MWLTTARSQHRLPTSGSLIGSTSVSPSAAAVRDLGVFIDQDLTMKTHVRAFFKGQFRTAQVVERRRRVNRGSEGAEGVEFGGRPRKFLIFQSKIATFCALWALFFYSSADFHVQKSVPLGLQSLMLHAHRQQNAAKASLLETT